MKEEIRGKLEGCNNIGDFKKLSAEEVKSLLDEDTSKILTSNNTFLGRNEKYRFEVFNLPQGISCPESTEICRQNCYQITPEGMLAAQGCDSAVLAYRKMNLLKSLQNNFVDNMVGKILRLRPHEGENIIIRIHASGDFYSPEYMRKWFEIALRIHKLEKPYKFVAYTKSMNILRSVMANKEELDKIYNNVCGKTLKKYKISDFNINLIGSVMDDTNSEAKEIMNDFKLPKYIVTNEEKKGIEIVDCKNIACADCKGRKCYTFPMKDVYTKLRKN